MTFAIDGVQLGGVPQAILRGLRQKQVQRQRGIGEATAGVDPWPETVGDVDRGEHPAGLHPADADQRADTRTAGLAQRPKAVRRENAVLMSQGHQVGDRPQGGKVEVVLHRDGCPAVVARQTEHLQNTMDKFEDQAGGAKRLPRGIHGIVDPRVDEGADGMAFLGHVVVDDHDVDPLSAQPGDLRQGIRAAVKRDEEVRPGFRQHAIQGRHGEAVALLHPTWDEIGGLGAKASQAMDEHRRARHPVDVVVAKDGDTFAGRRGLDQAFGRRPQATDRERIGDMRQLRAEVPLGLPVVRKEAGQDGGDRFADS